MSWIEEYAAQRCAESKEFAEVYAQECEKMDLAMALVGLRDELGLTQKQLAHLAGKPQSTIARIENGTTSPTVGLLTAIATSVGRTLQLRFSSGEAGRASLRTAERATTLSTMDNFLAPAKREAVAQPA